MNTVHLANHTGYAKNGGARFDGSHLASIFNSLDDNHLVRYDALLIGYIGSESSCWAVEEMMKRVKEPLENRNKKSTTILLDPVMGDDGHLYIDEALVPIYRNKLLPLATIVTPNQFEAE